jgi:hypothetical protein
MLADPFKQIMVGGGHQAAVSHWMEMENVYDNPKLQTNKCNLN